MTLLTTERPQTDELNKIFVRFDMPRNVPADEGASTLAAVVDLIQLGKEVAGIRSFGDLRIRSIRYGSPFEVILVATASASSILAVAAACTKVMNGLADYRVKTATARNIIAKTDSIRIAQARQAAKANWRLNAVTDPDEKLAPVEVTPPTLNTLYSVAATKNHPAMELDELEVENAQIIQADRTVLKVVGRVADSTTIQLATREVRSLLILGAHNVEIRVLDEGEEPHAHD